MKITLSVQEINRISAGEENGFYINVEMEPWRIKKLIFKLWNKFPDEFEECLREEGIEVPIIIPDTFDNKKYLIRPSDYAIFEEIEPGYYDHQESSNHKVKYVERFLIGLGFYPATEEDIPKIRENQQLYSGWQQWRSRSDGHGCRKGGTMEEFLQLENKEIWIPIKG